MGGGGGAYASWKDNVFVDVGHDLLQIFKIALMSETMNRP